jgi:hypothetical protein
VHHLKLMATFCARGGCAGLPADARHCNLNDAPTEFRFAPCIKEVKGHIDMLIDKEYIERVRDDEQHATYRYLA